MASKKISLRPAPDLKVPMVAPKMRIGLLGGSFDPAHEGHRRISLAALQRLGLDQVWWLVSPSNPLKKKPKTADLAARVAAARDVAHHPRIVVTGFEGGRPSAYTIDTIRFLKQRYPSVNFVWLMGADNLASFHLWRAWTELFELVPIAVLDRPGFRLKARAGKAAQRFGSAAVDESDALGLATMAPPAWTLLTLPLSGLSSTALRGEKPQASASKAKDAKRNDRKASKAAKKATKHHKKATKKEVKKAVKRLKKAAKPTQSAKVATKSKKPAKTATKQVKKQLKRAAKLAKSITKKSKKKS